MAIYVQIPYGWKRVHVGKIGPGDKFLDPFEVIRGRTVWKDIIDEINIGVSCYLCIIRRKH